MKWKSLYTIRYNIDIVIDMIGCLNKLDIENIGTAMDVYESEVVKMADDTDQATSELGSLLLDDIKSARSKLPGLVCGI